MSVRLNLEEVREHEAAHAAMFRHYGWTPRVEIDLLGLDCGSLGRVTVDPSGPDGHDWSKLARAVIAYAPAVMVFWGSSWEDDAFGTDRAKVTDATPALWRPYPTLWLSKVHDEAVGIVRTDEYRQMW